MNTLEQLQTKDREITLDLGLSQKEIITLDFDHHFGKITANAYIKRRAPLTAKVHKLESARLRLRDAIKTIIEFAI